MRAEPATAEVPGTGAVARAALLAEVRAHLASAAEARWLVEDVTAGCGPGPVPAALARRVRALAQRVAAGEPFQYVLGHWAFRSLDLVVDPRVLIPRPETEQVVEVALGELRRGGAGTAGSPARVVDLGTGSGAVALALAVEAREAGLAVAVWAVDASADALAVAATNRDRVGRDDPAAAATVQLARGSWWEALPAELAGRVDLAVANPPYVAAAEWDDLEPPVRAEPRSALVADDAPATVPGTAGPEVAGFADVAAVLAGAPAWLAPGGTVVVELAPSQTEPAVALAAAVGLGDVRVERDLAGRQRMVVARR